MDAFIRHGYRHRCRKSESPAGADSGKGASDPGMNARKRTIFSNPAKVRYCQRKRQALARTHLGPLPSRPSSPIPAPGVQIPDDGTENSDGVDPDESNDGDDATPPDGVPDDSGGSEPPAERGADEPGPGEPTQPGTTAGATIFGTEGDDTIELAFVFPAQVRTEPQHPHRYDPQRRRCDRQRWEMMPSPAAAAKTSSTGGSWRRYPQRRGRRRHDFRRQR